MITALQAVEMSKVGEDAKIIRQKETEEALFKIYCDYFDGWVTRSASRGVRTTRVQHIPDSVIEYAEKLGYTINRDPGSRFNFPYVITW